ncbi:hypothetical protein CBR_g32547 [Chara braunii]|uniref:Uncharacterized protein n=1 Tax=Chara braunii TaxID=69332 RepID=A0A388LH05_CHABU|nr:hypothetical protein CBR_g32547 [Chara braunii]|eukprot:GBG81557.1 hypothetical protein CBR_g32547 [Chara braunii]
MALAKQILQSDFTDDGPHDKDPDKGSRHWLCNYCETRFAGTKSVLKKHFMTKCSIELVTRAMTAEERMMRIEGIRLGKHQACQLAAEVRVDEFNDAPLEHTWLQNNEEENFADDEDDIAALERTWHANTKPGKHRVRELRRKSGVEEPDPGFMYTLEGHDRALKACQTSDWVQGREAASGRGRRKNKATASDVAPEQPVHKRKRKVGEGDVPPKKKRGRPPLSSAKKAAKAAARAEAAKVAAVDAARPAKRRTTEVIEGDEENPCRNQKKQSSSTSSSSVEDCAPQNIEEDEEMSLQSDDSGEPDGDESEEDLSQAESHGEEQSREEDE